LLIKCSADLGSAVKTLYFCLAYLPLATSHQSTAVERISVKEIDLKVPTVQVGGITICCCGNRLSWLCSLWCAICCSAKLNSTAVHDVPCCLEDLIIWWPLANRTGTRMPPNSLETTCLAGK